MARQAWALFARPPELVATYPADARNEQGEPYFSAVSCCQLAMKVAKNDLENPRAVMGAATIELSRFPEDKICSDGTEVFASGAAATGAPNGAGRGASAS